MRQKFCPNCNNRHIVPDGRTLNGVKVLHCGACGSWFTDEHTQLVLFQSDGGDDVPDEPLTADEREELRELLEEGRSSDDDAPDDPP